MMYPLCACARTGELQHQLDELAAGNRFIADHGTDVHAATLRVVQLEAEVEQEKCDAGQRNSHHHSLSSGSVPQHACASLRPCMSLRAPWRLAARFSSSLGRGLLHWRKTATSSLKPSRGSRAMRAARLDGAGKAGRKGKAGAVCSVAVPAQRNDDLCLMTLSDDVCLMYLFLLDTHSGCCSRKRWVGHQSMSISFIQFGAHGIPHAHARMSVTFIAR
jgi:hypothetical protein